MLINKPLIIFMDTIKMVNIGWRRDPKLQATSNRLQDAGFKMQASSHKVQVAGLFTNAPA
jgi:hypothetical protein